MKVDASSNLSRINAYSAEHHRRDTLAVGATQVLTAATLDTILNKLQKEPLATKTKMPARAAKAASFLDDLNFDEDFDF